MDTDTAKHRPASTDAPAPSAANPVAADRAWRGLYVVGGISAWLYVVLAVIVTGIMTEAVDGFWDIIVDGAQTARLHLRRA